jgi:molybdopterin molybdotransferase
VVSAALAEALVSPPDKRQFRRGVLDASDGTVAEVGAPASHLLASLALADCLIVVPEGVSAVDKGVAVEVWLLEA